MKEVALKVSCIKPLQYLNSDHRSVLMRLGSLTVDCPPTVKTITNWEKVLTMLEEIDTPIINMVDDSSRVVPVNSERKELLRDVSELVTAKNAALRRASKYPTTCENRSHSRAFQRRVKTCMQEVRNDKWSDLMVQNKPSHKAYWGLAKGLKTEGAVFIPALRKPDDSMTFDDRVEEEVRRRVSLPPKDNLGPITQDESDALYDLRTAQNKFCRNAADASWYVRNSVLHRDLELPTVSKFMKDASEHFFDIASSHQNPLLISAVSYVPPPSHHFDRRPRNVLFDPLDDLTVEVEKLLEFHFALQTSRDLYAEVPATLATHRAVTRRRHLYAELAASDEGVKASSF
ncbi:hypothetical protein EVAR_86611_1 [Eumeta japonica]|uniref:Uncharacterized protein n=1 Tax=Eumeta variegata TaxID=151549 RepID=A0A4C1VZV8_EUMVA|nr:hypothetical protein EVAR_86611_1 [Eumeta japonica]